MSDWWPGVSRAALQDRAAIFAQVREFFAARQVLEVDTPLLASYSVTDPSIEPLKVFGSVTGDRPRYLQTSPEYAMKRLLASGSGDIYQLGKAFRDGEGRRHNPEFSMLEWYRLGFSLNELMQEVGELVAACLDRGDWSFSRYPDLFEERLGLDLQVATDDEIAQVACRFVPAGDLTLDRDGWLDLLMSHVIEPGLGERGMVFVHDFPASKAALARCREDRKQRRYAERFELFVDGVELANGYRELLDADELARRAEVDNRGRQRAGQESRALDPRLHAAMTAGLPDCSGVALGVDRLLMLRLGADSLAEVMPFDWSRV